MKSVELIFDADCVNVEKARKQLQHAFAEAGITPFWQEWERNDPASPSYVQKYGSPTILVEGEDVCSDSSLEAKDCCRLYTDANGNPQGVPSVENILEALMKSSLAKSPVGWRNFVAVVPGIGVSFLPAGLCPACWPAYAGLLSSLGLGFLGERTYLLPLTILFLIAAVCSLFYRARMRWGYGPFVAGLIASVMLYVGKFVLHSNPMLFVGVALLVGASLWNSWPQKKNVRRKCPTCVPENVPSKDAGEYKNQIKGDIT